MRRQYRWMAVGVAVTVSGLACLRTPMEEPLASGSGGSGAGTGFGGTTGEGGGTPSTQGSGGSSGTGASGGRGGGGFGGSSGRGTGGVTGSGGGFGGSSGRGTGGVTGSGGGFGGSSGRGTGGVTGSGGGFGGSSGRGTGGVTGSGGGFGGSSGRGTGGVTGSGGASNGGGLGGGGTGGIVGGGPGGSGGSGAGGGSGGAPASCGNGVLDPGEQCDLGAANADRPAFLVTQGNLVFAVTPYARVASSTNFYNYVSASGHTGLEKLGTSLILLYLDRTADALSLVVEHGIDANTTSQQQPPSRIRMLFSGLPGGSAVAVSDDPGELAMSSATTAAGRWAFQGNTDGGVLTGFPIPGSWEVLVSPAFLSGIMSWTWVQGSGSPVNLDLTVPIDIKADSSPSSCRTNCTIPRCGDGILDGGEVCDDGNQVDGDGCSSDCRSAL